jgi:hypothetical protein
MLKEAIFVYAEKHTKPINTKWNLLSFKQVVHTSTISLQRVNWCYVTGRV